MKIRIKEIMKCFKSCFSILFLISPMMVIVNVLFTIISGVLPSVSIWLLRDILNIVQDGNRTYTELLRIVLIYLSIDIISGLIVNMSQYQAFILNQKSSIIVSEKIMEITKKLELMDFEDSKTYDMLQRAKNESKGKIFNYVTQFFKLSQSIITVITSIAILQGVTVQQFIIIVIVTVSHMNCIIHFGKKKYLFHRNSIQMERKKWYYEYLLTNNIAFKEIKVFSLNAYFRDKYKALSYMLFDKEKAIVTKELIAETGYSMLNIGIVNMLFYAILFDAKSGRVAIGNAVAFIKNIYNIKANIENVCIQIASIIESTLYVSQLFELLDKDYGVDKGILKVEEIECIELKNVSYKYKNTNKYALKNVCLRLEKGDRIYIVGKNGSGKSTLVKILAGLYPDYEGEILINGIELKLIDKNAYRNRISVLMQDFVKYELTLKENVEISNINNPHSEQDLLAILKQVGFDTSIDLNSQLGLWFEKGSELSGGEWLKIALARMINRKGDFFILDEPDSALDTISRKMIMHYYDTVLEEKIGIYVTHKISCFFSTQSKIVVMDDGGIIGVGEHSQLYLECEDYRKIVDAIEEKMDK